MFESLNFRYFGPVDGHDVEYLSKVLADLKDIPGPKLLHVVTRKGAGYAPAEEGSATKWHAPGLFNKETGEILKGGDGTPKPPKFQDVFGHSIIELAKADRRIVGVTPAMPSGCSLKFMMEEMPDRAFDVGIAEQHAVTFSAGMATRGLVPFCNIYSSFMQRAYDQVIHDVALQNLHVVFCLDRGGLVGADGPTHHGVYDLAYMRCIPNLVVSAPMDEQELRNLMYTSSQKFDGPFVIRYPRGTGSMVDWQTPFEEIEIGRGRRLRQRQRHRPIKHRRHRHRGGRRRGRAEQAWHFSGSLRHAIREAARRSDAARSLQPFKDVITIEDGCVQGGMGSAVTEWAMEHGYGTKVARLGVPDRYIEHGTQAQLYKECGYDADSIVAKAVSMCEARGAASADTGMRIA